MPTHDADTLRELLVADLALAHSIAPVEEVARAIQAYWAHKDADGPGLLAELKQLSDLDEEAVARLQARLDDALAEAKGDPRFAMSLRRGIDATIYHELSIREAPLVRALAEAGVRARAPLRTIDEERYLDFDTIGQGGMGVVYLALDTELNRRVALKIVRPDRAEMGDSAAGSPLSLVPPPDHHPSSNAFRAITARFLQEAWVTGGLEHPGVVPVYELGQTPAGVPYYAMRYMGENRTLATAIAEAKSLGDRLDLLEAFLKICDTMSYAHSRGVIHRDLKPANVAQGSFGEVVVLDWGLARLIDRPDLTDSDWRERVREFRESEDFETAMGALGTPGYMAPEAVSGNPDLVTEQSDVYSLGAILYVLLTGELPFRFTSFSELAIQLVRDTPPTPQEREPAAPAGLSAICMNAIARDREDRIASARDLAAAVRAWQRESATQREVDVLLAEAEAGLRAVDDLAGEALLRQVEKINSACAGVLRLRDHDERATEILGQSDVHRERAVEERARAARKKLLGRLSWVGVVFLIVVTWLVNSRRQVAEEGARRARALALMSAAREAAVEDPMLALLLAREAVRAKMLPQVVSTVHDLIQNSVERVLIQGHEDWVQSAVYSPQGDRVLTASGDGTARIWDLDGNLQAILAGHEAPVDGGEFSPSGELLVTASRDATARVWKADGTMLAVLRGHEGGIPRARFSPSGDRVLTASFDSTARVWSLTGKQLALLAGHGMPVLHAEFSPAGDRIVTASSDGTARVWDLTGKELAVLRGHEGRVWMAQFNPAGDRVVTASSDGTARIWDLDGRETAVCAGHRAPYPVTVARFSPDGGRILTASGDGTARLFDLEGRELAILFGHQGGINAASFSGGGDLVLTGSADGTARVWTLDGLEFTAMRGHQDAVQSASFSPRGDRVVSSSRDRTARIWSLERQEKAVLRGHTGIIEAAIFSPTGEHVLTASIDGTVRVWDLLGGEVTRVEGLLGGARAVAFSPDGRRFVTGTPEGRLLIWDLSGTEVARLEGHTHWVSSVCYSPQGDLIASAGRDHTARLWDAEGHQLSVLREHGTVVYNARFSKDGNRVLTACADWNAYLWNRDGELLRVLDGHGLGVGTAEFSPDDRFVLTGSEDRSAILWNLEDDSRTLLWGQMSGVDVAHFSPSGAHAVTCSHASRMAVVWNPAGEILAELRGHSGYIRTVEFSPDGQTLLTGSLDGTARLWDLEGNPRATLSGHTAGVTVARFSPDGRLVLTASRDGTARLWMAHTEDLLELMNERISRDFTPKERDRYSAILSDEGSATR